MITGRRQRIGKILEKARAIMMDLAELAMHAFWGTHHFCAKRLTDGLMSETNPKHWYLAGGRRDQVEADACLVRIAGARGDDDSGRIHCHRFLHSNGVVAMYLKDRP